MKLVAEIYVLKWFRPRVHAALHSVISKSQLDCFESRGEKSLELQMSLDTNSQQIQPAKNTQHPNRQKQQTLHEAITYNCVILCPTSLFLFVPSIINFCKLLRDFFSLC